MPLMVRFGIADKVDLLTLWSYKREKEKSSSMEQTMNGINTADIGLRFNIFEETDKAPALGFEAFYKTELTSKDYKPNYPSAKLNLMTSKSISKLLSITANLGLDVAGQGGGSNGFYTFNLVFAISEHLSLFAENYGDFTYENINVFFDFGGAYLIGPNLQLDLYGGFGSNDGWSSSFVSGGISYRITSWRK